MHVTGKALPHPTPDLVDPFLHFLYITKFLVKSGSVIGVLEKQESLWNRDTFQFVSIKETAEGQHTILEEFLPLYSKKEKNVLLPRAILMAAM